jgi:hypothetical protein
MLLVITLSGLFLKIAVSEQKYLFIIVIANEIAQIIVKKQSFQVFPETFRVLL